MDERITVQEAARMIGCREQEVRVRIQRGHWDIGWCDLSTDPAGPGKQRKRTYYIYRSRVEKMIAERIGAGRR